MWQSDFVAGKATRLGHACFYQGCVPEKYDSREALFAEFNKQIFEGPILQFTFCSIFTGHVSTTGIDLSVSSHGYVLGQFCSVPSLLYEQIAM